MEGRNIKKWFILVFLVFFVTYGLFKSYKYQSGPKIYIENPANYSSYKENLIGVEGVVKNIAFITLNGRTIYIDKEGRFKEELILIPGYNIMTIEAQDRFGRSISQRRFLYYEGKFRDIKNMMETPSTVEISATTTATTTSN